MGSKFIRSLLAVLTIFATSLRAEPADDFLKAYFLIQEGESAEKGGDTTKALDKFNSAAHALREIRTANPDWNPNIIGYRQKYCHERIVKLGGKVDPADAASVIAEAGPSATSVETTTAAPINTVPLGAVPTVPPSDEGDVPPTTSTLASGTEVSSDRVATLERELGRAQRELKQLQAEKTDLEDRLKRAEDNLKSVTSGDAKLDALLRENDALKQKLAIAEERIANLPSGSSDLQSVRAELAKAQSQLEDLRKENDQLHEANASLKQELDDTRTQLKTAGRGSLNARDLTTLQKENSLLRSIVDRQYQEDAKRTAARDSLAQELATLASRSESMRTQLDILQSPLTPLSAEERELLRSPDASLRAEGEDPTKLTGVVTANKSSDPMARLTGENASLAAEAKSLFAKQDMDGAAEKYEQIIKSEPNNLFALSNLGVIRFRQDRLSEAKSALEGCLAIDARDAFSLSVLGIVHYRLGHFDEAISSLTRAVSINPTNHETHNYLGITYSQKGYQEAAEKELLRALEIAPAYPDAHFNIAVVYASQTPPAIEMARKHYKKALDLGMAKDPELEKLLIK